MHFHGGRKASFTGLGPEAVYPWRNPRASARGGGHWLSIDVAGTHSEPL